MCVSFVTNFSRICCVSAQDIRRFFAPTAAKAAVQKPAPNGNEKKRNPLSSDEDLKKKDVTKAGK